MAGELFEGTGGTCLGGINSSNMTTWSEWPKVDNNSTACTQRGHVDLPTTRNPSLDERSVVMYFFALIVSFGVVVLKLETSNRPRGDCIVVWPCGLVCRSALSSVRRSASLSSVRRSASCCVGVKADMMLMLDVVKKFICGSISSHGTTSPFFSTKEFRKPQPHSTL